MTTIRCAGQERTELLEHLAERSRSLPSWKRRKRGERRKKREKKAPVGRKKEGKEQNNPKQNKKVIQK